MSLDCFLRGRIFYPENISCDTGKLVIRKTTRQYVELWRPSARGIRYPSLAIKFLHRHFPLLYKPRFHTSVHSLLATSMLPITVLYLCKLTICHCHHCVITLQPLDKPLAGRAYIYVVLLFEITAFSGRYHTVYTHHNYIKL